MKKTIRLAFIHLVLVGLIAAIAGCAGLSHHKNEAAIQTVHKVAVAGFCAYEPAPSGLGLDLGSGKLGATRGGSLIAKNAPEVNQMYGDLAKQFGKNLHWKVVSPAKMKQNAGYTASYERTMKGWQNKMPPGAGQQQFLVENVMDCDSMRILGAAGRTELMRALAVDALITAKVNVFLTGTTVMGIGSRYPQSRLSFQVFTPNADSADWFEGGIDGEPSKESVGKTGFFDEKDLNRLALESARTAFVKIGKTVQD